MASAVEHGAGSLRLWVKIALLVLLVLTLVVMARTTLGLALASRAPDAALRINPSSSTAQGQVVSLNVQKQFSAKARARLRDEAAQVVERDPTNVVALTALGMATDDLARARAIMASSDQLSRRWLLAQLWLIQDAVNRNDVGDALVHYDVALRTSPRAAGMLYPILVEATSDHTLLPDLTRILARQPSWGPQYLQQLAQSGTDLDGIAMLYTALIARGVSPGPQPVATAIQRMVDKQRYDAAWRLYTVMRPGQSRDGLRNGGFEDDPGYPTVFDWQMSDNQADLATSTDRQGGRMRLTFAAGSGSGGVAARQLMLLDGGSHTITATAYDTRQTGNQRPFLRVICAITSAETARFPLPNAGADGRRASWRFQTSAGCPAQWLEIQVPASDSFDTNTGGIGQIRVS